MDLSIVIPAFREENKIRHDVEAAAAFLVSRGLAGEIIVVDDGSTDDTRAAAAGVELPSGVERQVISYSPNRGKGFAVRTGIAASRGSFVLFADSGLCIPFEQAMRGVDLIKSGRCDIAHGSRKLPTSVLLRRQRLHRRLMSWAFRRAIGVFMHVPRELTDTQCGFKVYRGDVARRLYGQCRSDGFMFDVEILLRAIAAGYRVLEFPVEWRCDLDTRLHPGRSAASMIGELKAIKRSIRDNP
jgi:dolichyl-phosphate beta-glucosyltransferase